MGRRLPVIDPTGATACASPTACTLSVPRRVASASDRAKAPPAMRIQRSAMTPCVCNGNMAACEDRETQLFQIRNALLIMFFQSGYKDNRPQERGPFIELTYQKCDLRRKRKQQQLRSDAAKNL